MGNHGGKLNYFNEEYSILKIILIMYIYIFFFVVDSVAYMEFTSPDSASKVKERMEAVLVLIS